jgi:hypothetical protein
VSVPVVHSLAELAELVGARQDLYVRWSDGPDADAGSRSRDHLTGVELPGLSASALSVEPWWAGHPPELWVARRLHDYRHLEQRRRETRAWLIRGRECGRGPDNEPLVTDVEFLAAIAPEATTEAARRIERLDDDWGPLDRGNGER